MDDREYRLKFFEESHYNRRVCTNCGTPFWTKAKDRYLCADVLAVTITSLTFQLSPSP